MEGGSALCYLLNYTLKYEDKTIPFKAIIASSDFIIVVKILIFIPYHVSKPVKFGYLVDIANSPSSLLKSGINYDELPSSFLRVVKVLDFFMQWLSHWFFLLQPTIRNRCYVGITYSTVYVHITKTSLTKCLSLLHTCILFYFFF